MSTYINDDCVAIIPAAGQGERLGLGPKVLLKRGGQTLIEHLVAKLEHCVSRIIVGVPPDLVVTIRELLGNRAVVVAGGATRQATLRILFDLTHEPYIVVHDVTRPFASVELIKRVIIAGRSSGVAGAFLHPPVPVAREEQGILIEAFDRSLVVLPQSPQCYQREKLAAAFRYADDQHIEKQTLWQIVVLHGQPITVVAGEERNIKITTPLDWEIAQKVIWPE